MKYKIKQLVIKGLFEVIIPVIILLELIIYFQDYQILIIFVPFVYITLCAISIKIHNKLFKENDSN